MDIRNNHAQTDLLKLRQKERENNGKQSSSIPHFTIFKNPSSSSTTTQTQIFIPYKRPSLRLNSTNGTSTGGSDETPPPTIAPPPETVEIRFKRGSRKRIRRQSKEGIGRSSEPMKKQQASDPPKKWEDMNFTEKKIELYMGEKGLLFWLNKFAYASILIVIGGWILFRFVGTSLNLYELDTPPLSPSNMFKGS